MGQTKQLLPWPYPHGKSTLLATAFDLLSKRCREMVLVLGHDVDLIQKALGTRQYISVLSDPDAEMSHSFQLGLAAVIERNNADCVLLYPADHPFVDHQTLASLIETSAADPEHVIIPRYHDKGGHPTAIPSGLFEELSQADLSGGLNQWFRKNAGRTRYLEVTDPTIIQDIDSPSDLG